MTKNPTPRLGQDPERDTIELVSHMRKLAAAMNALKTDVAENSSLTQATLDKQIECETRQNATDKKLDDLALKSEEMLAVFNAGKKGVGFFKAVGRGLSALALWVGPILVAGGAIWALFNGHPPKGPQ